MTPDPRSNKLGAFAQKVTSRPHYTDTSHERTALSKFLSDEYMAAAAELLGNHPGFMNAIADVELDLQFVVTDAPEGDIEYRLAINDGAVTFSRGTGDNPDVTVTNTYETAVGISTGELNTQMAFMTGKLKVAGNMAVLMRNQGVINQFATVLSSLEVEY